MAMLQEVHNVCMATKLRSELLRIDIQTETDVLPDGTRTSTMRPHPDRYEQIKGEDGWELHDRQTGHTFPAKVSREIMQLIADESPGLPLHGPPAAPKPAELFAERGRAIRAGLAGSAEPEAVSDPSSAALVELAGQNLTLAVVCVDLIESTALQAEHPDQYNRLVPLLLGEIGAVSSLFGGLVIKHTGDGALVGFAEPVFCVAADMAFDAASAIVSVVYMVLNPIAQEFGLPPIAIRVGADANDAQVQTVGHASNRRAPDVLGIAVSMAAKIEGRGASEEVWVGQYLQEILHVSRQELLSPASPSADWGFVDRFDDPYRLYRAHVIPRRASSSS
jgi:class 3 adenylate cyclase